MCRQGVSGGRANGTWDVSATIGRDGIKLRAGRNPADRLIDHGTHGIDTSDIRQVVRVRTFFRNATASVTGEFLSRAGVLRNERGMTRTDCHLPVLLNRFAFAIAAMAFAPVMIADEQPPKTGSDSAPATDDGPGLDAIISHDHEPIVVRSRPVIERLPVKVIEPVDLKIATDGVLYVADRRAECVFRLDVDGAVSFAVQQLPGIQRIQLDRDDNLFVLTSSGGASAIHQITSSGRRVVLDRFEFPASAFVRDPSGETIVAVANTGRLMSLNGDGELTERAALPAVVNDVALNAGRQVEALLSSGHVASIPADGRYAFVGFAPVDASRLMLRTDGMMIALHTGALDRPGLFVVSRDTDRPEEFVVAAHVPPGTQGVGYDSLGNLCLVNPDLRAVTKVTTHFMVPCPHCNRPTRMILSTDEPSPAPATSRKF